MLGRSSVREEIKVPDGSDKAKIVINIVSDDYNDSQLNYTNHKLSIKDNNNTTIIPKKDKIVIKSKCPQKVIEVKSKLKEVIKEVSI